MPHSRIRHIGPSIEKAARFWPVVALLGPRQAGKSTLFRDQTKLGKYVTFDDQDAFEDASTSAKNFLQKMPVPLIIDEAQKCPRIFDSIKYVVDQAKRPGTYFLTGSSQFSAKVGVRESLTGRMGTHFLYPMTLAEAASKKLDIDRCKPDHTKAPQFKVEELFKRFFRGGMPVPLFTRDETLVTAYFQNWLDTSILRDLQRVYGAGYNSDISYSILNQITSAHKDGEYAGLKHFKQSSRVVRRYLCAMEEIFLIYRISPIEESVGGDVWTLFDTGLLCFLAGGVLGEGLQTSLARISILNEIFAACEYSGKRVRPQYYKTARGSPIDLIWDSMPIKISNSPMSQVDYDLRPLRAAVKKLNAKGGRLLWRFDKTEVDDSSKGSKANITLVPWTQYS